MRLARLFLAALGLVAWSSARPCSAQALSMAQEPCLVEGLAGREAPEGLGPSDAFAVMNVDNGRLLWRSRGPALARTEVGPGSLFKIISAYAALDGRIVDPQERVDCRPGRESLGPEGQKVRCWHAAGHGPVNLRRALAESCNRYFAWLGIRVGTVELLKAARAFGLGRSTGSGLAGEAVGALPQEASREMAGPLAVGQAEGLRVTPLQMLALAGALANGGLLLSPGEAPLRGATHFATRRLGVLENAAALRFIREGLIQASVFGTGSAQGLAQLGLAGKTGTAGWRGTPWRTHGWYLGFAPAVKPSLALVVFIHEGQGSKEAASAARQIMETLQLQLNACSKELP